MCPFANFPHMNFESNYMLAAVGCHAMPCKEMIQCSCRELDDPNEMLQTCARAPMSISFAGLVYVTSTQNLHWLAFNLLHWTSKNTISWHRAASSFPVSTLRPIVNRLSSSSSSPVSTLRPIVYSLSSSPKHL